MKKKLIALMLATMVVLSFAACGTKDSKKDVAGNSDSGEKVNEQEQKEDTSLTYIQNREKLILGLDDSFPPMGFRDDADNIVGFDIDLAKAVAEKLGVELVLQPIEWDAKELELSTKNIDCIWNGFSLTPERLEKLTMSIPYMENSISLVVAKDSGITTKADMAGKRLAVQSGSSGEDALNSDDNKEFRESLKETMGFSDYITALMDLETKNSDAVLMDSVVANYMIKEAGKDFVVLDDNLIAEEYGIGFRKGEDALCDAVEGALKELKADGKIAEISTKWFGSDMTIIQ